MPVVTTFSRDVRLTNHNAPWLRLGVSTLALVASAIIATPAFAQDTDTNEVADPSNAPEIVVTGFRAALQSAQGRKENADTVIDSITAEDIGALPDRSVTEALQRIPGVTINRFSAGVDPDHFSVEGSGVTIRGLSYVGSRFNGRDAFSAGNGSGLSFADVPSELLAGVDVYKTPSADLIEGGIGGIVNLRTRLPFDQSGLLVAGSLELNYGDFVKKSAPTFSGLISNRWSTGIGEIGLLASASYSQLYSQADRIGISSFRPRTTYSDGTRTDVVPFAGATAGPSALFPRGAVLGRQNFNRERYGYSAAAQWESNDGTLAATFQFLRSDARQAWSENTIEIATDNVSNNGDSRAVAGTSLEFDDSGVFENGVITGPTGWRADQQNTTGDIRTPILGLQSNNIRRDHYERIKTTDYSANLRWTPSENLAINLDYQHVDSKSNVEDNTLWGSTYQDAMIDLNGHGLPFVQFIPPQNCDPAPCQGNPGFDPNSPSYFTGSHQDYLDPFNSFYRSAMDHLEQSDGSEDAFRVDAELSFPDSGFLKSLQVGGRYADTEQTARFSIYNWGVLSEQWGNGGPVWFDDNVDSVTGGNGGAPLPGYEEVFYPNFFRGAANNPIAGQGRLFYSGNTVKDRAAYIAYANAIAREWQGTTTCGVDGRTINAGWNSLADRCGNVAGTPFQPGEINPQQNKNLALYGMIKFDSEFGSGMRFTGNVGLRYTRTKRTSQGFQQFANNPTSITSEQACIDAANAGQPATGFCTFTPAVRQQARNYMNGALLPIDAKTNYDYFLPSVNLKLEVGGGLQFRAGYFKGVFAPPFGFSRNYFNVTGLSANQNVDSSGAAIPGSFTIQSTVTAGNPNLLPTTSDNFDLTAEYYFSKVGQVTLSMFHKRLHNVVTNATVSTDLTNNGATFPVVLTTAINSPDTGKVTGAEVSYQQVFDFLPGPLSGLGLQATYTYVKSSGVPQTTLSATDPDVAAGRQSAISGDSFPLQGLSKHTINITPFIDIGPLSLRASYNWRSRYLLTIRDVITPFDPIFQRAYGQLDASATVTVTDQFKLGIQAVNILNSQTKTEAAVLNGSGDIQYVPRQWYMSDRRFTILARFTF